jgi:3-phenylpropionate/trans-cinnamate dioxygenase ferredoxin reductase subunit
MNAGMVIVGAGECGGRAALALRDNGYTGDISLIGAEALAPYERPPLSKSVLVQESEPAPKTIATQEALRARAIGFLPSTGASAIDLAARSVTLSHGARLYYDKLLLATGARPRLLALPGAASHRVLYLRDFEDAKRLRREFGVGRRIAIVGGGFIGLEIAASARKLGCEVIVVEALARLLSRGVPEEIAAVVADRHRAEGVRLVLGLGILGFEESPNGIRVLLANGEAIAADFAVIGVGAQPNGELAQAAGLAIDNGIAVDDTLRTSDPHVFAAGDCCSFPLAIYDGRRVRLESWRNALDQGQLAARNMLGAGAQIDNCPWFWSDQYDLTLQVAGLVDPKWPKVRRDLGDGAFIMFHQDETGRLLAASGIGRGGAVAKDIRLAEMLIVRRAAPDPALLGDSTFRLKSLLSG